MTSAPTFAIRKGPRNYQEDFHLLKRIDGIDFFGWLLIVADGHGGAAVAKLCVQEAGSFLHPIKASEVEEALHAFVQMAHVRTAHFRAGSTFSAALILENHKKVSIAVLGDSPVIVLDQDGQLHISPEHNVRSNLKERKAAQKRGGIYRDGYIFTHDETRGLQMSRALGNAHLNEILLREPDVYTITNPQWILVASDGVFDPGHHNTSSLLEEMRKYAAHRCTADDIMQWAEHRGLHDNATALVWRCSPIQRQITWLSWVNHFFRRIFYTTHFIHQKEAI